MNLNQAKARVVATGNVMAVIKEVTPAGRLFIFRDFTHSSEVRSDVGFYDAHTGVHCYGDGSGEAQEWTGSGVSKDQDSAAKAIMEAAGDIDVHGDSLQSKYLMAACIAYKEHELSAARSLAKQVLAYVKLRGA